MTNTIDSHPTPDCLAAFVAGRLSDIEVSEIELHLSRCESCCEALEALPDDSLRPFLRGAADKNMAEQDSHQTASTLLPESEQEITLPGRLSIPGYEVLQVLGRGGMGVVYKARQIGLNRLVALKMILAGEHAGPDQVARFRREAEAAARLKHPNIVQIYEIGEQNGLPYFSLELVEGGSLAQMLLGTPLPARPAAELIEILARAIHYAHQQGVVHRDLKPSNILLVSGAGVSGESEKTGSSQPPLTTHDSPLTTPKITDFGLAKRLDVDLGLTRSGAVVGTPSYMAPEQAGGQGKDIGPAADVYALGSILYELLTGRPPFKAATPADTLLQLMVDEPVSPRRLQPRLPRDLETVCLKCLEKELRKRYASAEALAEDLRRWLDKKPIQARATPAWERALKWAKRRPAAAALLIVSFAALAVLLAGGTWYNRQLQAAVVDAKEKEKQAQLERERANRNATSADDQRRLALETLKDVVFEIQTELTDRPGTQELSKKLLQKALATLERLERSAETAMKADHTAVWSHLYLGDVFLLLGETLKAQAHYKVATGVAETLAQADPDDAMVRRDLSGSYLKQGDIELRLDNASEAQRFIGKALELRKALAQSQPADREVQRDLSVAYEKWARVHLAVGKTREARDFCEEAVKIREKLAQADLKDPRAQRDLSVAYYDLAGVTLRLGNTKAALALYHKSHELDQRALTADPANALAKRDVSISYDKLGEISLTMLDPAAAMDYYQKARKLRAELATADPGNQRAQRDLGVSYSNIGHVHLQRGEAKAALEAYHKALEFDQRLADADPQDAQAQRDLASTYDNIGHVHIAIVRDPASAQEPFRKALALREALAKADPRNAGAQRRLKVSYNKLGMVSEELGDVSGAQSYYRKALEIAERLAQADPGNADARRDLMVTSENLGDAIFFSGDLAAARKLYIKALGINETLAAADPESLAAQMGLVFRYYKLGRLEQEQSDFERAHAWYERGLAILRRFRDDGRLKDQPDSAEKIRDLEAAMAVCKAAPGAIQDLKDALSQPPNVASELLLIRSRALARRGRLHDAAAAAEKLSNLDPKNPENHYKAARGFSLCSTAVAAGTVEKGLTPDEKERYAARAIDQLAKARAAGFFKTSLQVGELKKERDFESLRSRADFQKLLAELEPKEKTRTK